MDVARWVDATKVRRRCNDALQKWAGPANSKEFPAKQRLDLWYTILFQSVP